MGHVTHTAATLVYISIRHVTCIAAMQVYIRIRHVTHMVATPIHAMSHMYISHVTRINTPCHARMSHVTWNGSRTNGSDLHTYHPWLMHTRDMTHTYVWDESILYLHVNESRHTWRRPAYAPSNPPPGGTCGSRKMESSKYVMPAYALLSKCNAWLVSQNTGQMCNTFNDCNALQHAATRCNRIQGKRAIPVSLMGWAHTTRPGMFVHHTATHCITLHHTASQYLYR